jgi:DNA topoisomerase-2
LPTLLLNGSDGLSTGFRQLILPRNIKDIVSYISKKLSGTKNPKIEFLPWYRNFKGLCRYNAEGKIEILGKVDKNNATNYTISELPIGLSFSKYKEILEDLCDNKVIVDYIDKCDPKTNTILFEIKTTREFTVKYNDNEKLLTVFKLIKSYTEQLNCIDENNRVREFNSISEILDAFIEIRLSYYQKRKEYLITTTKKELDYLFSKYLFCKGVIDETINVRNVPNAKIIAQLEKIDKIIKVDDSYDYLLRIPIGSITKEGLEKLKKDITENKELYKLYKDKDYKEFWIDDLKELKEKIR